MASRAKDRLAVPRDPVLELADNVPSDAAPHSPAWTSAPSFQGTPSFAHVELGVVSTRPAGSTGRDAPSEEGKPE